MLFLNSCKLANTTKSISKNSLLKILLGGLNSKNLIHETLFLLLVNIWDVEFSGKSWQASP